jgi:hypothetical protein
MIPIYLDLLEGLQNIFTIGATNGGFPIGKIIHHLKKLKYIIHFLATSLVVERVTLTLRSTMIFPVVVSRFSSKNGWFIPILATG